jgi:predicted PurR-regulated permease PerM
VAGDGRRGSGLRLTAGGLGRAAQLSAQVLLVLLALWAVREAVANLSFVLVPVAVALLLAAFLQPLVAWLRRHHVPRGLATVIAMLTGLAFVAGLVTFVTFAVLDSLPELSNRVSLSLDQLHTWLRTGPLHLGDARIQAVFGQLKSWLTTHQQALLAGTMGLLATIGQLLAEALLVVVTLALVLYDGPRLWSFALRLFRRETGSLVDRAGRLAFTSVVRYVRTTALIALIDAVGIGIGLVALRIPLALPLATLVFLGAFVPYVGSFLSGTVSVAVALVSNGPITALIALGVIIAVQQLEGHVLQPWLTGNIVRLHPLVVLLAIAVGGEEAGIPGAVFAVPAVAAGVAVTEVIADHQAKSAKSTKDTAGDSETDSAPG